MLWNFHGLTLAGQTNTAELKERWEESFASLPSAVIDSPDLRFELNLVADVPPVPAGNPHFRQGDLLAYYLNPSGQTAIAHFPRFGQLTLDLTNGTTHGQIVSAALNTYGALEDLIAIGLSPHLRRRDLFLIHAFAAAAPSPTPLARHLQKRRMGEGVLIVGSIGAGKTTTGMSLLNAGWKLISNDSPILNAEAEVLQYPGLLAAYPETFARFPATTPWAKAHIQTKDGRKKLTVTAEAIWPEVWCERAAARAIVFPQIENRSDHAIEKLSAPEALRHLLPHAVEQWDTTMMPEHLRVLRLLVERAPAYLLRLGPEVLAIPEVVASLITHNQ
jgi:hypothetical protein